MALLNLLLVKPNDLTNNNLISTGGLTSRLSALPLQDMVLMKNLFESPNVALLSDRILNAESSRFVAQPYIPLETRPTFFLDDALIERMQYGNPGYQNLREIYATGGGVDSQLHKLFYGPPYRYRIARFDNAYVTSDGLIHSNGEIFRNGGCLCSKEVSKDCFSNSNAPSYKKVISLTAMWSGEVWHFVAEALASLVCLLDGENITSRQGNFSSLLFDNEIYLQVGRKNGFSLQWINLVLGDKFDASRIVEGDIFAEQLIIPEMGRCGWPYAEQVLWLHNLILSNLRNNFTGSSSTTRDRIVLIKRNSHRAVANYNELYNNIADYAALNNNELYVHDDAALPSVLEQLKAFNESATIIAPHGAGCINALAANPGTTLIELFDENWLNLCFAGLAYKLQLNYYGLLMRPGAIVNIDQLNKILATKRHASKSAQLLA